MAVLLTGAVLQITGTLDGPALLRSAGRFSGHWWFPLGLAALQALMFAVAWPGSLVYWVAGAFYTPAMATLLVVLGGTVGSLAAYTIARRLKEGEEHAIARSRHFAFLARHTGFAELCMLRMLPNFPHAVINYGAGLLDAPLPAFLASTVIGFTAKGFLYASAIHGLAAGEGNAVVRHALLPLLLLAALFLAGKFIRGKALALQEAGRNNDDP